MQNYVNALLLRFDGQEGENAPTKAQVAVTFTAVTAAVFLMFRG
jgi:hypothetical protein